MSESRRRRARAGATVRPFEEGDAGAVSRLLGPHQPIGELRGRWGGADPSARALVVEVGDRVMGFGTLELPRAPRSHWVADVAVALEEKVPDEAAEALVDALVDLAERWLGALRLQTRVPVDEKRAITLLRRRHFEIEGVARAAVLRDGELVDVFYAARVAEKVPWRRITAEDVAQRPPPQLTAGADPEGNGHEPGSGRGGLGWGFGLN